MYVLVKFQLHLLRSFGVIALLNSNNRKINLYKYKENKLQVLTKTVVINERNAIQSRDLHHRVCHEQRNPLLGKFFLLLPSFTTNKDEINEENLITYYCFDVT